METVSADDEPIILAAKIYDGVVKTSKLVPLSRYAQTSDEEFLLRHHL